MAVMFWTEQLSSFRLIADYAPFIIWMCDADGFCHYLNPAWTAFTGQPEHEGLGNGWTEMIHPDDRPHNEHAFLLACKTSDPCRLRYRLHHHGDDYRWVIDTGRPTFSADGVCTAYVGTVSAGNVVDALDWPQKPLTNREREVLTLSAQGKTAPEIGIILGLSTRTIEAFIASSIEKTNSSNRTQAVVEAIRAGEISAGLPDEIHWPDP